MRPVLPTHRLHVTQARGYVVQRGDTLSAIALKLGTTVPVLARLNRIRNVDLIHPGQVILMEDPSCAST